MQIKKNTQVVNRNRLHIDRKSILHGKLFWELANVRQDAVPGGVKGRAEPMYNGKKG